MRCTNPLLTTLGCAALAASCLMVTACGGTTVTREDSGTVRDLSGNWNATDSREVANAMIVQLLEDSWIDRHTAANNGERPVIKVGRIDIRTQNNEYIDTNVFTNDLIRSVISSGRARAVRATGGEQAIRDERAQQEVHATDESRNESFQELGANYLMTGSIRTQNDREGRTSQRFWQVDLQLEDITTGEIVWLGTKEHTKLVERSRWN